MSYNETKIGFTADINKKNNPETYKSLEEILNFEIEDINSLKNRILEELKEIEDLKHNISILKEKIKEIEKLDKLREEIIEKIFFEENNPKINIEYLFELFNKLNKINEKISIITPFIFQNIEKLMINQTTLIYSKENKNKKEIEEIHNLASSLHSKLRIINTKYSSLEPQLGEIYTKISKIKSERNFK
jgi:vacuolar-type H+-ATPase subunit I/STV1